MRQQYQMKNATVSDSGVSLRRVNAGFRRRAVIMACLWSRAWQFAAAAAEPLHVWQNRSEALKRHTMPSLLHRGPSSTHCRRTSARTLAAPIARAGFSKTLLRQEGAGNAGSWPPPWPACKQKTQAADTTGTAKSPGIPCAIVLRLIRDLPGARALLPPSPESLVSSRT